MNAVDAPVHYLTNAWFPDYRTPPLSYDQFPIPGAPLEQSALDLQQWPDPFVGGILTPSQPGGNIPSQDQGSYSESPSAQKGSHQEKEEIVCYGMVINALTFMLRRERGWAFFDSEPDVWEVVDEVRGRFFLNRFSNASQPEEPPQCYGGIVADPMGLGKTLAMIALVATDLEESDTQTSTEEHDYLDVPTTLIIVPPPRWSRWAVTGTPIQNRLGDLATLFKFIRAHPYTDRRYFDTDISRLWKAGEYQEAIKRLKRLSKCLLLRRDKGTVSLPPRQDLQCPVDFDPEERAYYNRLREQAISSIDEVLKNDSGSSTSGAYVNVLQQIESLRLVCNLGLHYKSRHAKALSMQADGWSKLAQDAFNLRREMEPIICLQCPSTLDITETFFDELQAADQNPLFFSCLGYICTDCIQRSKKVFGCGHNPSCAKAHVSTGGQALEASLPGVQSPSNKRLPSKVEALIADIKALPPNEKCIVFSTWRLTLDVVEAGLNQSGISSVRFDGKVPQKDRQNIVDRFRHDCSIRVMLLTLSCGAAGLTLTVATRAYLMEPHWNPTVEEQALARIHRIGQSQEVATVRFFVRDSFEQQVIKVQESKRYLAGLLLSPHDNGQANENLGRLQELLSLI
ncbi:hypothetical protein FGRMN_4574 [Fusarium graminum]|nr:hypothetical protein FGRMN_4574 [Fusarium graminum]